MVFQIREMAWSHFYLARGVSPCLATAASEAMTTAPAPSQMPEADPAVTTPPGINFKKQLIQFESV
jgi:hypothetical protein